MWRDMWVMGIPVAEKVIRTVVVYVGLAVLLRLAGKRDLAQLNSFDLVVMLLLSNVVGTAIIGNDGSLTGAFLGAVILLGFNSAMVRLSARSDRFAAVVEGGRTLLARDGSWDAHELKRLGLRQADVEAALRRQNANNVGEIKELWLESGGALVADMIDELQSTTKKDIRDIHEDIKVHASQRMDRLEAKIDALLAHLGDGVGAATTGGASGAAGSASTATPAPAG